jgi:hypothetical protein
LKSGDLMGDAAGVLGVLDVDVRGDARGDERGERTAVIGVGAGRVRGVKLPGVRKKLLLALPGDALGEEDGMGDPETDVSSDRRRCDSELT